MQTEVLVGIITASAAIAGTALTVVHNIFRQKHEQQKYKQQIKLENSRFNFEEKRLAIELYNQRELKIFEERLKSIPTLSQLLLPLAKRSLSELTPEKALDIESKIRECIFTKIYHCMSTEALEALNVLNSSLVRFSENKLDRDELHEKAISVHRVLHKDLGRTGSYLGGISPQYQEDIKKHKSMIDG